MTQTAPAVTDKHSSAPARDLLRQIADGSLTEIEVAWSAPFGHAAWRNIRTLASHSPLDYKAHAAGNYVVNGVAPPANGYF
jgi:hypothetical protein